jgi:hypothetical protein
MDHLLDLELPEDVFGRITCHNASRLLDTYLD